ncbi:MAG TPA: hypothetical protein VGY53_04885, partial [Isosphaeraceae bacterium]|nr:hypothetical protein [Isosphaeraceae bacterium]
PLFQGVSALVWNLAGRRLTRAPLAFTLASYVPFLLVLWLLFALTKCELHSETAAWCGVAVFCLTPVSAETVFWYSASSFMWALLGTLLAWWCVLRGLESSGRGRGLWWAGSALAGALAPAFSGVGLLAGPVGAIRVLAEPGGGRGLRQRAFACLPVLGTASYLCVYWAFGQVGALTGAVPHERQGYLLLAEASRAIWQVLVPGLFGVEEHVIKVPAALAIALTVATVGSLLAWAALNRNRPVILASLALILGGYALTYSARLAQLGPILLSVQRYHLFPQLGLTLLVGATGRPWLARFDNQRSRSLLVATAMAALLLLVHFPVMRQRVRFFRFPEQARVLRALERTDLLCREKGITRTQALAVFGPVVTGWLPLETNALVMLPPAGTSPALPDSQVRQVLLSSLCFEDVEALCGGMDASLYLMPAERLTSGKLCATGQLVKMFGIERTSTPGQYRVVSAPCYLEYALEPSTAPARALIAPTGAPGNSFEIWWTSTGGSWSETRSARVRLSSASSTESWGLPLEDLPHWRAGSARRVRIVFRTSGSSQFGEPTLLR